MMPGGMMKVRKFLHVRVLPWKYNFPDEFSIFPESRDKSEKHEGKLKERQEGGQ